MNYIKAFICNFSQSEKGPIYDSYMVDMEMLCLDGERRKPSVITEGRDVQGLYMVVQYEGSQYTEQCRNINRVVRDERVIAL